LRNKEKLQVNQYLNLGFSNMKQGINGCLELGLIRGFFSSSPSFPVPQLNSNQLELIWGSIVNIGWVTNFGGLDYRKIRKKWKVRLGNGYLEELSRHLCRAGRAGMVQRIKQSNHLLQHHLWLLRFLLRNHLHFHPQLVLVLVYRSNRVSFISGQEGHRVTPLRIG